MGALLDAIDAQPPPRHAICSVSALLAKLSPEDAADFRAAMAGEYQSTAIYRAIRTLVPNADIKAAAIGRHRRGDCQCQKSAA